MAKLQQFTFVCAPSFAQSAGPAALDFDMTAICRDYTARRDYQPLPHTQDAPRHALKPRPLPDRVARKVLPGHCLNDYNTRRGPVRLLGEHCLRKNYRHVNRLPNECYSEVRSRGGVRRGYGPQCLRTYGYTFARN
jgi:hypothetical protein